MRSLKNRWLAGVWVIPLAFVTITTLSPLPAQAAGTTAVTAPSGGAGPFDRAELGLAMVALGLLIFALTMVRLRMQSRRRSSALRRSRWAKVTDTYPYLGISARRTRINDSYAYSGISSSRTNSQSRW